MAQYIDKDALVAEIEKRLDELWDLLPNASDVVNDNYTKEEANITGKYTALESFSKFIDTLETKEEIKIGETEIYLNDDGGEPPYDGKQWLDLSCTEYEIPKEFKDGDKVELIIHKIMKGE